MNQQLKIIDDVKPSRNLNRLTDVEQNIQAVRGEFVGKPEICHTLVKHIIYLRRGIDVNQNSIEFFRLLGEYIDVILKHYDVRWLLSICDTYVDHGDEQSSAIAMNIVNIINNINITHTILHLCKDATMQIQMTDAKYPTWGGMITCDVITGDTIHNMMTRNDKIMSGHYLLYKIWCEIKNRGRTEQNIPVNHICQAHFNADWRTYFK